MARITYPSYIPNWSGSRGRLYPSREEVLITNPQTRGLTEAQRKLMQRHHIDLDRMNPDPENIHLLDGQTHEAVHRQERALTSALIQAGIIGYDRQNPHYFVKDDHVRKVLTAFFSYEDCRN